MTLTDKEAPAAQLPPEVDEAPEAGNPSRVIQLLVALVVITAVFIALGWGYLLLFIAILFAIVMLHEFGHFITAKRAGMKVTEYFVGFGPRLWSVRRGETEYGVKAIPAGGYVRIVGFTSTEEVSEDDEPRAYRNQPFHQRIIVASAGSAMHLLIALVLALILVFSFGRATNNYNVAALEHWTGKTTPAALAGLRVGDTIVSVNGKSFTNPNSMTNAIKDASGTPLRLGVERDGKLIHLTATPENGKGITVDGTKLENRGYLGVDITTATAPISVVDAPYAAVDTMWQLTDVEARGIGQIFSPSGISDLWRQLTNPRYAQAVANNPNLAPRLVDRGHRQRGGAGRTGGTGEHPAAAHCHQHHLRDPEHAADDPARWWPRRHSELRVDPDQTGPGVLPRRHHQAVPRGGGLHRRPGARLPVRHLPRHHPSATPDALRP